MHTHNTDLVPARINASHLLAVAALEALCFAHPWSENALALLAGEGGVGFVLTKDGEALSYCGMMTVLDEGQITNVATHPAHRGCGYASLVLSALLQHAREKGLRTLSLEVRESNAPAIALYHRHGFAICGKRPHFYRTPDETALVMVATLQDECADPI